MSSARELLMGLGMRLLAIAAILLSSSVAAAQAPGQVGYVDLEQPALTETVRVERVSYRSQVLVSDGLSIAAMALGPAISPMSPIGSMGLSGFFLGAPLVHLAHGRGTTAVKSFALRTGLPMIGFLAGYKLGPDDTACASEAYASDGTIHAHGGCGTGSLSGALGGLLVGGVTAMVLDAKFLATYEVTRAAPRFSANVQHVRGGMTVGLSGAF